AEKLPLSFTVRVGDDVTLPCENVIDGQQKCGYTRWLFLRSGVELVRFGQIGENTKAKSDRLSVTENCSLVIKKVTIKDAGPYICQQYKSGQQQGPDSLVLLSVIIKTEHQDADKVTLTCSVWTYEHCRHTVMLLYEGKDVDDDNQGMRTGQAGYCYSTLSFLDSHYIYKSKSNLKCEVTDGYSGKVQLFTFSPQSSGEKTGENMLSCSR
ncbi:uncharacterized protein LOC119908616, partial [Micropterus salmoides]|uniref:uncharacterized protein LOC119908616 n=1 Tax=Micropterus salmoides TaxID=27706 RepID=UPI0018EBC895